MPYLEPKAIKMRAPAQASAPEILVNNQMMRDIIVIECQKINNKYYTGCVNYSEAKTKIFQNGLGLNPDLLSAVKISFNKCPVITFKLYSEIYLLQCIKTKHFYFERSYHSKGQVVTDKIECMVVGIKTSPISSTTINFLNVVQIFQQC